MDAPVLPAAGSNLFDSPVFNAQVPKEGPRAVAVNVPFDNTHNIFTVRVLLSQTLKFFSMVQAAFVDNAANPSPVSISSAVLGATVQIPPFSQAYIPLLVPLRADLTVQSDGETLVRIIFVNVPLPAIVWDAGEADAPAGTMTAGQAVLPATTATLIAAVNPRRISLTVTNPGTAGVYLGPDNTVTASTGVWLGPSEAFNTSPPGPYVGALWGYSVAGGTITNAEFTK